MSKYFVATDGTIHGECIVENPANPAGFQIVEIADMPFDTLDIKYIDGNLVPIALTDGYNGDISLILKRIYKDYDSLNEGSVNQVANKIRPGLSVSVAYGEGGCVGVFVNTLSDVGLLNVGAALTSLRTLLEDAAKIGCPVFGHLVNASLFEFYIKLGIALTMMPDGTALAIYNPDIVVGASSILAKRVLKLTNLIQSFMDKAAQQNGYDDIRSAALRAAYPGPFHDEGVSYAVWMDACWFKCYELISEVKSGVRDINSFTYDSIIQELPALTITGSKP